MAGNMINNPRLQYPDQPGGSLSFFDADAHATPLNTYSDKELSSANPNPITLDAAGRPANGGTEIAVFLLQQSYYVVLKDSAGTEIWDADDVSNILQITFTGPLQQPNIAGMTAILKANLTDDQQCDVGGYTTIGDDGGGKFYWDSSSSATADAGITFASDEGGTGRWIRIFAGDIHEAWFNVKSDGATDDIIARQAAWNAAPNHNGTVVMKEGTSLHSAELLVAKPIITRGAGRNRSGTTIIQPTAETFSAIRLNADSDAGLQGVVLEDFQINWASQATNSAAIGIEFDDAGGTQRYPYGSSFNRIQITNAYDSHFDDTSAFDIIWDHPKFTTPKHDGFNCAKAASSIYTVIHAVVTNPGTGRCYRMANIAFLKMIACAADQQDNSDRVASFTTCRGSIDSLDIESCETSASSLLDISGGVLTMTALGCASNTLSSINATILAVGSSAVLNLLSPRIQSNTSSAAGLTSAITIAASATIVNMFAPVVDALGGTGSPVRITDNANLLNEFSETGITWKTGRVIGVQRDFTDLDTTPDVSEGNDYRAANTGATIITDFNGGTVSQDITVLFSNGNTTLKHAGGLLILSGAADFTGAANGIIGLRQISAGVWKERWRQA